MGKKDYAFLLSCYGKYKVSRENICDYYFGYGIDNISETVIIAPWWEPDIFPQFNTELIKDSILKQWNVWFNNKNFTYIKTGIGASICADTILALGYTNCKNIIFIGSVGSLTKKIGIGDIVIPEYSISGDGICRYLTSKSLMTDSFGERHYPDGLLNDKVISVTKEMCALNSVKWHTAVNFSVGTIFAEYAHLEEILSMGSDVIEMETAAAFKAARLCDIAISAVFCVSDNTITNKTLYSGRTKRDMDYRDEIRRKVIPDIIDALL